MLYSDLPSTNDCLEWPSPQLVVDYRGVQRNVERMIQLVGGNGSCHQLRPHLKTHKMDAIARLQIDAGIFDFKASTLGEVAMASAAGARSVLLAHQPVGCKMNELADLQRQFPSCSMGTIVDDSHFAVTLAEVFSSGDRPVDVWIDVDCGMHRTGIAMTKALHELIDQVGLLSSLHLRGLHVYDGHLHQPERAVREHAVRQILTQLQPFLNRNEIGEVIVGGTPTFQIWVQESRQISAEAVPSVAWQFSPGTSTLWDWGYDQDYPDLPFEIAAAVLTRVISKPISPDNEDQQWVCLDLGHKAIASEMPLADRLRLPEWPEANLISQSEEHLVVGIDKDRDIQVGHATWIYPRHICPTVSSYHQATLVLDNEPRIERIQDRCSLPQTTRKPT